MNNLIRAEWFRLRHSGNSVLMIAVFGLIAAVLQFAGDEGVRISAETFFLHASMGMLITILVATGYVTSAFNSKLANYEIMKGTPPLQTILSKTLVVLISATVTYFLPSMILLAVFDSAHMNLSMMLLCYVCLAKMAVTAVAVCIICKNGAATVLYAMAFIFQTTPLVLIANFTGLNVTPLTSFMTSTQLMIIGNIGVMDLEELSMPLDTSYAAAKIIISFIIISAVMTALAHRSLKYKWQSDLLTPQ